MRLCCYHSIADRRGSRPRRLYNGPSTESCWIIAWIDAVSTLQLPCVAAKSPSVVSSPCASQRVGTGHTCIRHILSNCSRSHAHQQPEVLSCTALRMRAPQPCTVCRQQPIAYRGLVPKHSRRWLSASGGFQRSAVWSRMALPSSPAGQPTKHPAPNTSRSTTSRTLRSPSPDHPGPLCQGPSTRIRIGFCRCEI